jgi:hypothetical protein
MSLFQKTNTDLLGLTLLLGTRLEQRCRLSPLPGHIGWGILWSNHLDLEPEILRQTPHRKQR